MRTAFSTRRQAEMSFDGTEYEYEDVLAVQAPVDVPVWRGHPTPATPVTAVTPRP